MKNTEPIVVFSINFVIILWSIKHRCTIYYISTFVFANCCYTSL